MLEDDDVVVDDEEEEKEDEDLDYYCTCVASQGVKAFAQTTPIIVFQHIIISNR